MTIPSSARAMHGPAKAGQQPYLARQLSVPPWDVEKPPTAYDFWSQTPLALVLPAAAGSSIETTLATGGFFDLPDENVAVIKNVTVTIENPTVADSWRFTVLQDGSPIPGLANVGFPPVGAGFFALPINGTFQIMVPGAQLSIRFESLGMAGNRNVGGLLTGWYLPVQDIVLWTGQRPGQIVLGDANARRDHLAR